MDAAQNKWAGPYLACDIDVKRQACVRFSMGEAHERECIEDAAQSRDYRIGQRNEADVTRT